MPITPTNDGPVRWYGAGSMAASTLPLPHPPNTERTIFSAVAGSKLPTMISVALPALKWVLRKLSSASLLTLFTCAAVATPVRV